jgi:hypothetical protein
MIFPPWEGWLEVEVYGANAEHSYDSGTPHMETQLLTDLKAGLVSHPQPACDI